MAPAEVLRYTSYSTSARTLTFSGLSTTKTYSLELYASRANTGNSTTFTINGTAVTILTDNNKTNKAIFNGLTPTAGGQLVVSIANVNAYNYLNGLILTESNSSAAPLTGADISSGTTELLATTKSVESTKGSFELEASALQVKVSPNPSNSYFTITITSKSQLPVDIRLIDAGGRVVELRQNVASTSTLTMGRNLRPGIYYLEGVQGKDRQGRSLLKTPE
jgi:hypothetical protein